MDIEHEVKLIPLNDKLQTAAEELSKEGWQQWVAHQTMLINENRLTPIEPKARAFLVKEMEKFFFGGGSDTPPDFVPK